MARTTKRRTAKQIHNTRLLRHFKNVGFKKCPNCEEYGYMMYPYEPKFFGFSSWCYLCGYKNWFDKVREALSQCR